MSREPQQGRSRASYERMIVAAEKLLIKTGGDEFTLTEVAKIGRVSIGSIYLRFSGKDALIHAVHARVMERLSADQEAMLDHILRRQPDLDQFADTFVAEFAELLFRYSPILRPIMLRAPHDPITSRAGKESHDRFADRVKGQLLVYREEFGRPDHERLVSSAYRVIYATIARYLGLGSAREASDDGDWAELKQDLGRMCAAFLRAR